MNHTLSSARAMDGLTGLLTAPVQPWDAIICTSKASRAGDRDAVLTPGGISVPAARARAASSGRSLPVIPLGVDCDAQARRIRAQGRGARRALGLQPATSSSCSSAGCPFMPRPIRPPCTSRSGAPGRPPPGGADRVRLGSQRPDRPGLRGRPRQALPFRAVHRPGRPRTRRPRPRPGLRPMCSAPSPTISRRPSA